MASSEREVAQRSQEKFEFYLVGLVFTVLALSIQTAKFGQSNLSDVFELSGWVSLAVSVRLRLRGQALIIKSWHESFSMVENWHDSQI